MLFNRHHCACSCAVVVHLQVGFNCREQQPSISMAVWPAYVWGPPCCQPCCHCLHDRSPARMSCHLQLLFCNQRLPHMPGSFSSYLPICHDYAQHLGLDAHHHQGLSPARPC